MTPTRALLASIIEFANDLQNDFPDEVLDHEDINSMLKEVDNDLSSVFADAQVVKDGLL